MSSKGAPPSGGFALTPAAQSRPLTKLSAEGLLAFYLNTAIPDVPFEQETRFHSTRRWRCDFMNQELKIAIEVEGAVWAQGRHTRGSGFIKDIEKYNELALAGYLLIRVTPTMVEDGSALVWIERAIETRQNLAQSD